MSTQQTPAGTGKIWAAHALTSDGWQSDVIIEIDTAGLISSVVAGQVPSGERTGRREAAIVRIPSGAGAS